MPTRLTPRRGRAWLLNVDDQGDMTARALREGETIIDMEELREVMTAYDRLEHCHAARAAAGLPEANRMTS